MQKNFGLKQKRFNVVVLSWLMNYVSNSLLSGFINASNTWVLWEELKEIFDKINGARTFNLYKVITSLTQGTSFVSIYFTKLKGLWNDLEALVPLLRCYFEKSRDLLVYLQRQKLYQFIMGLNDTYYHTRSQILLMTHLTFENQVYVMILNDEGQKEILVFLLVYLEMDQNFTMLRHNMKLQYCTQKSRCRCSKI